MSERTPVLADCSGDGVQRVAVVGARRPSAAMCDALIGLAMPIRVDAFAVDERFAVAVAAPQSGNVRTIGGFEVGAHVDRFDLSARYAAVVYAFDQKAASRLTRTFVWDGDHLINDHGLLSGSGNEFVYGDLQRCVRTGEVASADTIASRIESHLNRFEQGSRGWLAVDPVSWLRTQHPGAVIVDRATVSGKASAIVAAAG